MSAVLLRAVALLFGVWLLAGCGGRASGPAPSLAKLQADAREAQVEAEVAQRALDLVLKQRPLEAAALWQQRIDSAGVTPMRLQNLCMFLQQAGELGRLAQCAKDMLAQLVNGRMPLKTGASAAQMAQSETETTYFHALRFYGALGDYPSVIRVGTRGAAEAKGSIRALILQQVGEAYMALGQRDNARKLLGDIEAWRPDSPAERAAFRTLNPGLGSFMKQSEDTHVNVALGARLTALQLMSTHLGEHEAALRYFDQNRAHEKAWQQRPAEQTPPMRASYAMMDASMAMGRANLLVLLGRFAEARSEHVLADKLSPGLNDTVWQLQMDRARIEEAEQRAPEAIAAYKKVIELVESQRATLAGEEARITFVGNKQDAYARLIALLIRTGAVGEAFEYAERGKSRALVDLLASRVGSKAAAAADQTQQTQLLAQLRTADAAVARADPKDPEALRKTRSVAIEAANRLKSAAPELAALVTVSHTPAPQLQALLKADETLVEFFGSDKQLVAFVATRQRIRAVTLEAALLEQVAAYRKAVQDPASRDVQALGRALHDRLIVPLGLPAKGALTLVPHGALHYLPFGALSNGKDSLLDRYTLRVLPSASVMPLLMRRAAPGNRNTLIVGNPDLGDAQYDLPGAQKEAEEIARLRPGAKLLLRGAATREALSAQGGQYATLHIASHGTFDASKPRSSGLLLANAPGSKAPTDGMLTVDALYGLRLNADLVTLSACETALADIQNGDDVVGLSRGFFYAGANNIVSSLWQVDDVATEQLMVQFYKLLPTTPKAEALRRAQLAVKARYPHPFYWAAFQLAGADAAGVR